jgi:PAS domain S-box-containing protein
MKRFRNFPIKQKILVMTLLICGTVLLVAIAALFVFQVLNFRSNFARNNAALAAIIADASASAMAFEDDATVNKMVASLQAKTPVLSATLVLPNGAFLAHVGTKETAQSLAPFPAPGESRFTGGQLLITELVLQKRARLGTLYLRTDYRHTFLELLGFYGQLIVGVTVGSIGLAVIMSGRLGRTITDPVSQLAATAKIVGEKKDYSARVVVSSHGDELGRLGESFNEMLGRIQVQDVALSLSQRKMEALINAIDGIVWERHPDTFDFTFISRQSTSILGHAPEAWLGQKNFWQSKLHPQDAAKAVQTGQAKVSRGEPYSYEYRMVAADGRTVWIRESGMVLVENGQRAAMRGIFQDITQQKLDEEQLDKLNRQLVDASRSAGMADVATGVLHNVGNVLNSVSVSTTIVGDRLRRSKVANLQRATAMLRDQNGHLGEFLTNDPKGRLLPDYLGTVAEQLTADQAELISEVDSMGEHIEHMKEIVAMQQSYAKVSGAYENLSPVELVEDALRMNVAAFERHRINLVRQFEDNLPKVCVDRHKFLQIFINLLRNAKHAMEDVEENNRMMTIQVCLAAGNQVKVTVRDNGLGIPGENLTKIFNHGFTTKKDGHGFGLHSGANAAKEMGGSLMGHSAGPGQGAEFTLLLPTSCTDRIQKQTPIQKNV